MSKGILDVVHSSVWGPAQITTLGGCHNYVMFIEDFSRPTWIYLMRQKTEVFGHIQRFKAEVEKTTSRHVLFVRSDRGKEYFSDNFTVYLRKEVIRQEFSCRHTPQ